MNPLLLVLVVVLGFAGSFEDENEEEDEWERAGVRGKKCPTGKGAPGIP
jgi:hypothetical protein